MDRGQGEDEKQKQAVRGQGGRGLFGGGGRWTQGNFKDDGRGGGEDWGEHGEGESAADDGRKSRKPTIRGGSSALRAALKGLARQAGKSDELVQ